MFTEELLYIFFYVKFLFFFLLFPIPLLGIKTMKNCPKKKSLNNRSLRFESLEDRQMLSVSPLSTDETIVAPITFDAAAGNIASTNSPENSALVSFASQNAPVVATSGTDGVNLLTAGNYRISVIARWGSMSIVFDRNVGDDYTVIITPKGKAPTYKNVKAPGPNNGICSYQYPTKTTTDYTIAVYEGKFTASTIKNATPQDKLGETTVSILSPPKLSLIKNSSTQDSITFKYSNISDVTKSLNIEATITGNKKIDGYVKFDYGFQTGNFDLKIWDDVGDYAFPLTLKVDTQAQTMTITGLTSSTKISFKITATPWTSSLRIISESTYSNKISTSTTRVQFKHDVADGYVQIAHSKTLPNSAIDVTWPVFKSDDATAKIASSYTIEVYNEATGKKVKSVTVKNAIFDTWQGFNRYANTTVTGLKSGTTYFVKVLAKKDSLYDASVSVRSQGRVTVEDGNKPPETIYYDSSVTTKAVLPTAKIRAVSISETYVKLQITNWDTVIKNNAQNVSRLDVTIGNTTLTLWGYYFESLGVWKVDGLPKALDATFDPTNGILTISGLTANTLYKNVGVLASGSSVSSKKATMVSFKTL